MGTQAIKGRPETGKFAADIRDPDQLSGLRSPFESYDFTSGGRWQPRVAGGGISALRHLPSVIDSVICHRCSDPFSPLSSVIDSVIAPLRVAGGSPGWRVAGHPPSVICPLSSIPSSVIDAVIHSALNAALHSVLCHLSSTQSSVIDSVIYSGWQVAAPGGGWRDIRPPSSALSHRLSHLSSMQ